MSDYKIGEQLRRLQVYQKAMEDTQTLIDNAIYELASIVGGKTFEFDGLFYQIRIPKTGREDRKRAASVHPTLAILKESPKQAKATTRKAKAAPPPINVADNLAALLKKEAEEIVKGPLFPHGPPLMDDEDDDIPMLDDDDDDGGGIIID